MSISSALHAALSGLTATARTADVVSSNLANLMTEGYGKREIILSPQSVGQNIGVNVIGVRRHVDQGLVSDRRTAAAAFEQANSLSSFFDQLENEVGLPGDPSSLSARISAFEAALVTASSRPDAPERLNAALDRAGALIDTFAGVSGKIQKWRADADNEIRVAVEALNNDLALVANLNVQITTATTKGYDVASLQDQRQLAVDRIATLVPVKEVPRDRGAIALFSIGGAVLLDGKPAQFGFTSTSMIQPHMTIEAGLLSGLEINGRPVSTSGPNSVVEGGKLAALFEIRDDAATHAQKQLDALARQLVERFQQPGLDPTLAAGQPGLFTDDGAFFDPANEVGLSKRMTLNPSVDIEAGGSAWRLRDGLVAGAPGLEGDASLLQSYVAALQETRVPLSGGFGSSARSASDLSVSLVSLIGTRKQTNDHTLTVAGTQLNELRSMELQNGVDSDAELQRLMIVEQTYAANARMIETIDEMLKTLMRI